MNNSENKELRVNYGQGVIVLPEAVMGVAQTAKKNDIMSAIVRGAGMESKAKTIVFSLPVTDTAGLRLIEEQTETV